MDIKKYVDTVASEARRSSRILSSASSRAKNAALAAMAANIRKSKGLIQSENEKDTRAAESAGLSKALIDRLTLTDKRIEAMAKGIEEVAALPDPVGRIISRWKRPNGLLIKKVRVPIGVIAIIFESRPNVTADSASLCIKSGNAVILRGGKEAIHSNIALAARLRAALEENGLPPGALQLIETTDREAVGELLKKKEYIDLVMPRGGQSLIEKVAAESLIPVIKHYKGVCHVYLDKNLDKDMARDIVINAKCQRPGVCNAAETLLVHEEIAPGVLPQIAGELTKQGVEIRGCPATLKVLPGIKPATEEDWSTEYLDMILSVKIVKSLSEAVDHINTYGSSHSDAIVTGDDEAARVFTERVDSAAVYVNASTRFTDGGEFGMGAEIGISTDKLHARGPMGLEELTTYKYVIHGTGQVRT